MTVYHCIICGEPTTKPIEAIWYHFRPIENANVWKGFVKGTYRTFGMIAVARLLCPALNTILGWKYRKDRLYLPLHL